MALQFILGPGLEEGWYALSPIAKFRHGPILVYDRACVALLQA